MYVILIDYFDIALLFLLYYAYFYSGFLHVVITTIPP